MSGNLRRSVLVGCPEFSATASAHSQLLLTEQIADHRGVGAGECVDGPYRVSKIVQQANGQPRPTWCGALNGRGWVGFEGVHNIGPVFSPTRQSRPSAAAQRLKFSPRQRGVGSTPAVRTVASPSDQFGSSSVSQ